VGWLKRHRADRGLTVTDSGRAQLGSSPLAAAVRSTSRSQSALR
jgi:hypothetical protein